MTPSQAMADRFNSVQRAAIKAAMRRAIQTSIANKRARFTVCGLEFLAVPDWATFDVPSLKMSFVAEVDHVNKKVHKRVVRW